MRDQGQPRPGRRGKELIRVDNEGKTLAIEHLDQMAGVPDRSDDEEMALALPFDEQDGGSLNRGSLFRQDYGVQHKPEPTRRLPKFSE